MPYVHRPVPSGSEKVTIDNTAGGTGLTPASGAHRATISVETAPLRYWVDGKVPTTAVGHLLNIGDAVELENAEVHGFLGIATTATATELMVSYDQ